MTMKKVFLLLSAAALMAACSTDESTLPGAKGSEQMSTEVYAMGKQLTITGDTRAGKTSNIAATRAAATDGTNWADAYFFIRIDGRIPREVGGKYNPNEYWPYDRAYNNGSVFQPENRGEVNVDYPYWKFYSNNGVSNVREYCYDTTGEAVESIIRNVPSFTSMMSVNKKDVAAVSKIDTTNLKILWYVAKYSYGNWHVDGVLTYKNVQDITEIPDFKGETKMDDSAKDPSEVIGDQGNVEVDIHQQEHSDWQEIKTSVHVRDLVDNITIEIPLEAENIAEVDDFAIRSYDLTLDSKVFINGTEYTLDDTNPVKVTIEHKADKAVFTIKCTSERYLAALRKEYGDGVTVEIHTYPTNLTNEEVWAKLKNATVKVSPATYERLKFKGATSAFFTE